MPMLQRDEDGRYTFGKKNADRFWTAYVKFEFELSDECSIEEIDIRAPSESLAYAVTEAALTADYEPGGAILTIEPRYAGIIYI